MKINLIKCKKWLLILFGVLCASCLTNVQEPDVIDSSPIDPCATITFSNHVKPIIDNNCIQCHSAGGNFPKLTTYNDVSSNATIVKNAVISRRMPQGSTLTQAEINAIECWVNAGALNN